MKSELFTDLLVDSFFIKNTPLTAIPVTVRGVLLNHYIVCSKSLVYDVFTSLLTSVLHKSYPQMLTCSSLQFAFELIHTSQLVH